MPSFFTSRFSGAVLCFAFLLIPLAGFPQAPGNGDRSLSRTAKSRAEKLWIAQDHAYTRQAIVTATGVSGKDTELFFRYLAPLMRQDQDDFMDKAARGEMNAQTAKVFMQQMQQRYIALYPRFQEDKIALTRQLKGKEVRASGQRPVSPASVVPLGGACTNADFELGTTEGWKTLVGKTDPNEPAQGDPEPLSPAPPPDDKNHEIMAGGFDPIVGSQLARVSPGGNYSLRLGDTGHSGKAAVISQTFTVLPGNAYFTYKYAVVLEEPTIGQGSQEEEHEDWQRPYFRVNLVENLPDGSKREIPCSRYGVLARPPLEGFRKVERHDDQFRITRTYHWRDWTTVTIPLDKYVGQNITITFTTSDCNLGAHLGYAYVDASCPRNLAITGSKNVICGDVTAALTAPEGFQAYQWSGPGLTGAGNDRQVTANKAGTYQVVLTPFANTDACGQAGQVTLQHTIGDGSDFTGGPDKTVCHGDKVTLEASGGDTYTWSPAEGLSNPNVANPVFTPARNETYTVEYTVTSCSRTDVVKVTVMPKIKIEVENDTVTICPGQTANLTATGADRYEWQAQPNADGSAGGSAGTGASISVKPNNTTTYQVTGYKGEGCSDTKSVVVIVTQVSIFGDFQIVCEALPGEDLPVETLFASGAATYTWSWTDPTNRSRTASGPTLDVTAEDLSPDNPTKYFVTGLDKTGTCTTRDSVLVYRVPSDAIRVNKYRIRICKGQTAIIEAEGATRNYYTYYAQGTGSFFDFGYFEGSLTVRPEQTTTYSIKSASGCGNTETVVVEVDAVDAGRDVEVCQGDVLQLEAKHVSGKSASNCRQTGYYDLESVDWKPDMDTNSVAVPVTNLNRLTRRISDALEIGFPFKFYCDTYSKFYISSGGFITFDARNIGTDPQRIEEVTANPPAVPSNLIAFAWATLDPSKGSIRYFTTGTAPHRRLVVVMENVPAANNASTTFSSQVILHETTNEIEIHITRIYSGSKFSIGIRNADGTMGLPAPDRQLSTLSAFQEAYRFTPPRQSIEFSWAPAAGLNNPGSATPFVPTNVPGEYTYIATLFNGECSTQDTVKVTVHPRPELTLSANQEICYGKQTVLTADVTSDKHVEYFYEWYPATGLDRTQGRQVTASPDKTTWYKVRAINGFGCVDIDSVLVTVNQLPEIVLQGRDTTVCRNSEVQLAVNLAKSQALPASYVWTWKDANGIAQTAANPHTVHPQRTTTYTVKGTDGKNCENTASFTVTVPESSLQVLTAPNDTLCLGETVTLTASGAMTRADNAYEWLLPDANGSNLKQATLTQKPTVAGTYAYKVTATDTCGNVSTREVLIVVNPLPVVVAQPQETAICLGSAAQLSVDIAASNATQYTWSMLSGTEVGTGREVQVKPTASAQYVLTGTDGNGCVNRDTISVTVNPLPVVTASPDKAICSGEFADLRARGALSYEWTDGTGVFSTGDSIRVTPAKTTTYYATGTDGNGCTDTARVTVTVRELTISPDTAICAGDYARLAAGVGYDRYNWTSGPAFAGLEGERVVVSPDSSTTYTVSALAPGCNATGRVRVTVVPRPVVRLGPDTLICAGETVALRAGPGGARYRWANLAHEDTTFISADSVLLATEPGLYAVEVFNRLGCSVMDTVRLTACSSIAEKYPLFIPNLITPNGDSYNDTWTVRNLDKYGANKVVIYNRWGHEVYRVNNYHNEWQGLDAANGVYYYHLWLEDGNRLFKGWIHVQR